MEDARPVKGEARPQSHRETGVKQQGAKAPCFSSLYLGNTKMTYTIETVVNGWVLTINKNGKSETYVYMKLKELMMALKFELERPDYE